MQYKGAVFFDYDGTLTDDKTGIVLPTEATRRAIAALRKNGYLAVLATGRAIPYVYDMGIEFDGMVNSNGTYALVGDQVIYDQPIDKAALARLCVRLDEMGLSYGIDHPVKCCTRNIKDAGFQDWIHTFNISEKSYRNIEPGEVVIGYKLSIFFENYEQIEQLRQEFGQEFTFDCMRAYKCADVNICGFSKASGVQAICRYFDLPLENTYAFGDSMNDLQMVCCVGHGVAMGDHAPELGKRAEFITRRVCEEGIEYGLKHYGLI